MKKLYLIILLLSLVAFAKTQTLVDINKLWSVAHFGEPDLTTTTFYKFTGDSLIAGNHYKKLISTMDSSLNNWYLGYDLYREDSLKKVYYYNGADYLCYDFGVNTHDTVSCWRYNTNYKMIVDSINTITLLNGLSMKRIYLTSANQSCKDVWIEGIGSTNGINIKQTPCVLVNFLLLCCNKNDTLLYRNPYYTKCYINTAGINENTLNNISIYPNPASSTLTIETNSNTQQKLEIVNLLGQTMYTYYIYSKTTVDVSAFAKGIYLLKLNTDKGIVVKRFVKE